MAGEPADDEPAVRSQLRGRIVAAGEQIKARFDVLEEELHNQGVTTLCTTLVQVANAGVDAVFRDLISSFPNDDGDDALACLAPTNDMHRLQQQVTLLKQRVVNLKLEGEEKDRELMILRGSGERYSQTIDYIRRTLYSEVCLLREELKENHPHITDNPDIGIFSLFDFAHLFQLMDSAKEPHERDAVMEKSKATIEDLVHKWKREENTRQDLQHRLESKVAEMGKMKERLTETEAELADSNRRFEMEAGSARARVKDLVQQVDALLLDTDELTAKVNELKKSEYDLQQRVDGLEEERTGHLARIDELTAELDRAQEEMREQLAAEKARHEVDLVEKTRMLEESLRNQQYGAKGPSPGQSLRARATRSRSSVCGDDMDGKSPEYMIRLATLKMDVERTTTKLNDWKAEAERMTKKADELELKNLNMTLKVKEAEALLEDMDAAGSGGGGAKRLEKEQMIADRQQHRMLQADYRAIHRVVLLVVDKYAGILHKFDCEEALAAGTDAPEYPHKRLTLQEQNSMSAKDLVHRIEDMDRRLRSRLQQDRPAAKRVLDLEGEMKDNVRLVKQEWRQRWARLEEFVPAWLWDIIVPISEDSMTESDVSAAFEERERYMRQLEDEVQDLKRELDDAEAKAVEAAQQHAAALAQASFARAEAQQHAESFRVGGKKGKKSKRDKAKDRGRAGLSRLDAPDVSLAPGDSDGLLKSPRSPRVRGRPPSGQPRDSMQSSSFASHVPPSSGSSNSLRVAALAGADTVLSEMSSDVGTASPNEPPSPLTDAVHVRQEDIDGADFGGTPGLPLIAAPLSARGSTHEDALQKPHRTKTPEPSDIDLGDVPRCATPGTSRPATPAGSRLGTPAASIVITPVASRRNTQASRRATLVCGGSVTDGIDTAMDIQADVEHTLQPADRAVVVVDATSQYSRPPSGRFRTMSRVSQVEERKPPADEATSRISCAPSSPSIAVSGYPRPLPANLTNDILPALRDQWWRERVVCASCGYSVAVGDGQRTDDADGLYLPMWLQNMQGQAGEATSPRADSGEASPTRSPKSPSASHSLLPTGTPLSGPQGLLPAPAADLGGDNLMLNPRRKHLANLFATHVQTVAAAIASPYGDTSGKTKGGEFTSIDELMEHQKAMFEAEGIVKLLQQIAFVVNAEFVTATPHKSFLTTPAFAALRDAAGHFMDILLSHVARVPAAVDYMFVSVADVANITSSASPKLAPEMHPPGLAAAGGPFPYRLSDEELGDGVKKLLAPVAGASPLPTFYQPSIARQNLSTPLTRCQTNTLGPSPASTRPGSGAAGRPAPLSFNSTAPAPVTGAIAAPLNVYAPGSVPGTRPGTAASHAPSDGATGAAADAKRKKEFKKRMHYEFLKAFGRELPQYKADLRLGQAPTPLPVKFKKPSVLTGTHRF